MHFRNDVEYPKNDVVKQTERTLMYPTIIDPRAILYLSLVAETKEVLNSRDNELKREVNIVASRTLAEIMLVLPQHAQRQYNAIDIQVTIFIVFN